MDSPLTAALAIAAAVAFAAALVVLVRTHLLPTGRDPVRDAVSDYGVGPHHINYRVMVVLLGVGAALLTIGLARDGEAENAGLAWLAAYAASRVAIAGFMTDLPDQPVTATGRIHAFLAAVAFTSIAFGAIDLTDALADAPGWDGGVHDPLRVLSRVVAITAVATLISAVVPALHARLFGLVERLLYAAAFAWLLLTSIHLAVMAG